MGSNRSHALYRSAKWFWLSTQCLLLPLSVLYLCRADIPPFPASPWHLLLAVSGSIFLILWLIAQSLLAMYRFPLDTAAALQLMLGQPLTFLFIFLLGGLPLFAAFSTFYTTLLALSICAAGLSFLAVKQAKATLKQVLLVLLIFLSGSYWLIWLSIPMYRALLELPGWKRLLEGLVLAANILLTGRTLWGTTIFAKGEESQAEYDEEWQHWAAPTIIGLILSAVTAAIVGGLAQK
jgi:hypothetical protein